MYWAHNPLLNIGLVVYPLYPLKRCFEKVLDGTYWIRGLDAALVGRTHYNLVILGRRVRQIAGVLHGTQPHGAEGSV